MQERLFSVSLTYIGRGLPWRNILRYGIRYFRSHRARRRGRYSYPHAGSCGRGRAWRGKPSSSSRLGSCCHQFKTQLRHFPHPDKSHLQEDEKGGSFHYVFWVQFLVQRSWDKSRICIGNRGCGSRWGRDWNTYVSGMGYHASVAWRPSWSRNTVLNLVISWWASSLALFMPKCGLSLGCMCAAESSRAGSSILALVVRMREKGTQSSLRLSRSSKCT